MSNTCTACLMPYSMDTGERQNPEYCSYCQKDGQFCFEGSRKDFQDFCYKAMREKGMGALKAKIFTFMIRFAPHWKQKK